MGKLTKEEMDQANCIFAYVSLLATRLDLMDLKNAIDDLTEDMHYGREPIAKVYDVVKTKFYELGRKLAEENNAEARYYERQERYERMGEVYE